MCIGKYSEGKEQHCQCTRMQITKQGLDLKTCYLSGRRLVLEAP